MIRYPELYPILDADALRNRGCTLEVVAAQLRDAGVQLVQYRDKRGSSNDILRSADILQQVFKDSDTILIMNDRVDLAKLAGWGVHVGQADLLPADARILLGDNAVIGVSTHNSQQVSIAAQTSADYIAVGPVFQTSTKLDAEPVVGLDGVRSARALTHKPIVAIGGITLQNARSVREAGADSIAIISALFEPGKTPGKVARDFLDILR